MTVGLLLVASAYAVPSAFDDARRMLTSILEEKNPTLNDTLAMLPEESPWYGVDPLTVEQCPAAAVVG